MDNGPSIAERVYAGIKADLLDGVFRPGERLDAATLAGQYGASVTPVREALNRLAGERLVAVLARQGFKVPLPTEGELRALYDWACQQLVAALRLASPARLARVRDDQWPSPEDFETDAVAAVERLCVSVAQLSGNARCCQAVEQLNAELRIARRLERELLATGPDDLRLLPRALAEGGPQAAEALLVSYHSARAATAVEIVGLLTMAARSGLSLSIHGRDSSERYDLASADRA